MLVSVKMCQKCRDKIAIRADVKENDRILHAETPNFLETEASGRKISTGRYSDSDENLTLRL